MEDILKIQFKQSTVDELVSFSEILNKDVNVIIEEALRAYFEKEQKKIVEKMIKDEANETTLEYDEFWDGLDIG